MSKTTDQLEAAVATVIENRPADGVRATARQRASVDRAFARILTLIAPRIRHFIRQYGLAAHWDDAEQVCAIAVHRAIEMYEPEKARFTTFVNWQIRGELQALRFRLMTDQRPSAKKVAATTVSLQALEHRIDSDDAPVEFTILDEDALPSTESGAASYMAQETARALLDAYVDHLRSVGMAQLKRTRQRAGIGRGVSVDPVELERLEQRIVRDRDIIACHLLGSDEQMDALSQDLTRERVRQITRRAARVLADIAVKGEHQVGSDKSVRRSVLPSAADRHNHMVRVKASVLSADLPDAVRPAAFAPVENRGMKAH